MTKTKNTRRALLISVLTMTLSFVMLIGTTFAWFTDTVSSGNNKIVAGNLDIEVTHTNNTVTNEALDKEGARLFPVELWEPGVVSYETFTVKNAGSLAFDYKFNLEVAGFNTVTVNGEEKSLKDVIKLGVIEGPVEGKTREELVAAVKAVEAKENSVAMNFTSFSDFSFEDYMEDEKSLKEFTIVAYWEQTENDNDYNINGNKTVSKLNGGKKELYIDIVVNVVAKQRTFEKDSFGNDYDQKAEYPVTTSAQLLDALQEVKSGDKIILSDGNYDMPKYETITIPEGVTITGGPNAVWNINEGTKNVSGDGNGITSGILLDNDNVTISGITVKGISNMNAVTGNGYAEYNAMIRITGNNVTLDNVNVRSTLLDSPIVIGRNASDENNITIRNCNITGRSKAVYIVDGSKGTVNIEGCKITGTWTINVNTNSVLKLVVKNSTLKGFTSYGSSVSKAVFEECKFEVYTSSTKYLVAYADTDLINCEFNEGFLVQTKNNHKKTMTFANCNSAGTKITADNVKEVFHANNDSDSIDAAKGWTVIVDGTIVETNQ